MLKKIVRWLIKNIRDLIVVIMFLKRLFKIVIVNHKHRFTVNKILLLLRKEYKLADNQEKIFPFFRKISREKIPNKIEYFYLEFYDKKQFHKRVEILKSLLEWFSKLDRYRTISQGERFIKELHDDAVKMVQEKAKKTRGDGKIGKDLESLKNIFDLTEVYKNNNPKFQASNLIKASKNT